MVMKRKLMYLPYDYSKEMVDAINLCFDKGYEIEDILNADNGYYMLLVLKCDGNYSYTHVDKFEKSNLIEEKYEPIGKWIKTSTMNDIIFDTNTNDTLLN
jgi:hypothetical protein